MQKGKPQIHHFRQGSPEWHQHRARHYNASDAAVLFGLSTHMTRTEMLDRAVTGLEGDIDVHTQRRFDDGHKYEDQARSIAEKIIGEELFPQVVSREVEGMPLSMSSDGLTMGLSVTWEHKTLNKELEAALSRGEIPEKYHHQLMQGCIVSGAGRALFMASRGTEESALHAWFDPEDYPELGEKIVWAWKEFHRERQSHKPAVDEVIPARPDVEPPPPLTYLDVRVQGQVVASNLDEFEARAIKAIEAVNTDLKTDEDFATAEQVIKWCGDNEASLKVAKDNVLNQMADVNAVITTLDRVQKRSAETRLMLTKLVKAEKDRIKADIVLQAQEHLRHDVEDANAALGGKLALPAIHADFAGAMKNLRTLKTIREAVNVELARARAEISATATKMMRNLAVLREQSKGYEALFPDAQTIVTTKTHEDVANLVAARIAEHKAAEDKRIEEDRARIRAEEEARAKEAADRQLEAERERIRADEEARRRVEAHQSESAAQARLNAVTMAMARVPDPNEEPERPRPAGRRTQPEDGRMLSISQINEIIAPFRIDAAGLSSLGAEYAHKDKNAKMYSGTDVRQAILNGISILNECMAKLA